MAIGTAILYKAFKYESDFSQNSNERHYKIPKLYAYLYIIRGNLKCSEFISHKIQIPFAHHWILLTYIFYVFLTNEQIQFMINPFYWKHFLVLNVILTSLNMKIVIV